MMGWSRRFWAMIVMIICVTTATQCSSESGQVPQAGRPGQQAGGQGQGQGRGQGRGAAKFPVEAAPVEARTVQYTLNAIGTVEAFEVVQVTARVSGVVEHVRFKEGDFVKMDQSLVEIEPDRYRLTVESARATLEKTNASKAEMEGSLSRREAMIVSNPGLIPGEEIETWRTRVQSATAEQIQAQTALNLANLNLRDAFVRPLVSGVIQTRTVRSGQYVQPGTVLATLIRRDPMLLRFQIPELDAIRLRPGMTASFTTGEADRIYTSTITSVGETANSDSRMIIVTSIINDPQRTNLRPGTFAQVTVPVDEVTNAPVIPQIAVRASERGFLAFVIVDSLAQERVVDLGMRTQDGLVEVRKGLVPGEVLVVRGGEALRNGSQVRIMNGREENGGKKGPGGPGGARPEGGKKPDGAAESGPGKRAS